MKRINLLPREVAERRKARQQVVLLVVLGLVWLLVLSAVWFVRQGQLREEEERLSTAQAEAQALQVEIDALQEFADLDRTVREKEEALATAMLNDIHWSRILIELSMIIPGDSWITSFQGTAAEPSEPTPGTGAGGPKFGSVNFSAITFEFPGVAAWITRLQEMDSLQSVWVPSATRGTIGTREVVNFSSSADLSGDSLSERHQPGGPE